MDWQNERYIRSYTRDTVTRKVWTWEARAIWDALMRKVDRAGVMDIGEFEPAEAVAAMIDIPLEVVSAHLPSILKSKAVIVVGPCLVSPNFVEAQEANQSDKQRQAESRARRKDKAMRGDLLPDVTKRDEMSHAVTDSHSESHGVTPSLAVPSQAEPSSKEPTSELASEPTENAPPHDAPGEPDASLGSEDTSGVPKAPQDGTSQASEGLSLAKRKPKKTREPSPEAIEIAQRLYQAINAHSPDMFGGDAPADTAKRMLGWTLEIDRGLRAKDITVDDALLLIDYAHHPDDVAGSNGFTWHTNLLSGVAMRKQWKAKALLGKAKRWREGKGQGSARKGKFDIAADDYDYAGAAKRSDELFGTGAP